MAARKVTKSPTEAQFEAQLNSALERAFPWIPKRSIEHQTKFHLQFGRAKIEIDGMEASRAEARTDILLHHADKPLAVLELKRPGVDLSQGDEEQGLSYARVLHPRPPLVVVTNGEEVRLIEVHTGEYWEPDSPSAAALADLIRASARAATDDVANAVGTLMGSSPRVWIPAVTAVSQSTLREMTGSWENALLPFVNEFLIPRDATREVLRRLRDDSRLVVIEGPPLVGKSSVLREAAIEAFASDDLVFLLLEANSGRGVFQRLADAFGEILSWPVSPEDVRRWLFNLSHSKGPTLVIAVDGMDEGDEPNRGDVIDLSSHSFGSSVRVAITLDDSVAERMSLDGRGRQSSALGRRATTVRVGRLNDQEFGRAREVLQGHRMTIMKGGESSPELRVPWILRSLAARIVSQSEYSDRSLVACLPSMLGLDLFAYTRARFAGLDARRALSAVAKAVVSDAQDRGRPVGLVLEALGIFVIRRATLRERLDATDLNSLIRDGYLKPVLHESGEDVCVARLPELVASEAAFVLGSELSERANADPVESAKWLATVASLLPLGDMLAAQALLDSAQRPPGIPTRLIEAMLALPPEWRALPAGSRAAAHLPGLGLIEVTVAEDGSIYLSDGEKCFVAEPESDDPPYAYSDLHAWLALSYLAGRPFTDSKGRDWNSRLLLEVGRCPTVLCRPSPELQSLAIHELGGGASVVCHNAGLVEPITFSMFAYLAATGPAAELLIEQAERSQSVPLLMRLHVALQEVCRSGRPDVSAWASRVKDGRVEPALKALQAFH